MRYNLSILITAIFAFALFTACQKASVESNRPEIVSENPAVTVTPLPATTFAPNQPAPSDDAPRITLEEAKKEFDNKAALFIDTRPDSAYKVEHIKGAVNIPLDAVETRYKEIPKNKKVIAYCS